MKKRILSVLLGCSLLFGTVFANAVSIEFGDLEQSEKTISTDTDDATITYEELEAKEDIIQSSFIQDNVTPSKAIIENIRVNKSSIENIEDSRLLNNDLISVKNEDIVSYAAMNQGMRDVEYLIGRYQFNIAAGSNLNSAVSRELGHSLAVKKYEKDHTVTMLGNSSGGYLDGSYNADGNIYKAYLVIETSEDGGELSQYPIMMISNNNTIEEKIDYYFFTENNQRVCGYMDVTNFVKENGYGWYYVCNIPYNYTAENVSTPVDHFADWKLVVIEENRNIPVRMLKLSIGCKNIASEGDSASIILKGEGIRTSKKNVTGQILFGVAGGDMGTQSMTTGEVYLPYKIRNYIGYRCKNADEDIEYNSIITSSGIRSIENPFVNISSRNGIPLKADVIFEIPKYYNPEMLTFSENFLDNTYMMGSGDLELLDVNTSFQDFHNVAFLKDKENVEFQFKTLAPIALMIDVLGICADIDIPEYTTNQESIGHNEYYATINGNTKNTSTLTDGIGLNNGQITVSVDKQLKILSTKATFVDINGKEYPLTKDMYSVNEENNTITYTFGKDKNGKSMIGEYLTYEIETVALESDTSNGYKKIANNEVQVSGYLISNNVITDYWMDKVAWDTSSVQIKNPPKVLSVTLKVNPNGGIYEDSVSVTEIKNLSNKETVSLSNPTRKGYTFTGWEIVGDTTATMDKSKITIGYEDVEIKANWKVDQYKITINPNGGTIDNKTDTVIKTLDYGTETEIPIPKRLGYVFVGWENSTPDVEITGNKITVSDKDTILTAKWVLDSFDVTYIDVTPDGKELGRQVLKKNYNSTVKGSDIGSDKSDNAYYIGYGLDSWTEATVTLEGATVYRFFEYQTVDMNSNLKWNDNNDADGFRPSKYKLKLKQDGKVIDEVELPSDETSHTFPNLPKYDSAGKPYHYSFEVDASDRYKINFDEDGNLIVEDYQPANFSVIIPKMVVLDGKTGNAAYTVSVNGTFYYNDSLSVIPESSLTLNDRSNISSMGAIVSQQKTGFTKEDGVSNGITVNGTISADRELFAGSWQGDFNFDIKFRMQN